MKKNTLKRISCILLSALLIFTVAFITPISANAETSDNYVNIMHKINTARPNFPIRYNFSLEKESDIYFDLRINERTTIGLTIKNQKDEVAIKSDTLPSTDPNWQYNSGNGIYRNTHIMHLPAGNYILEMNFETEVNYDLSVSRIMEAAKLNYTKLEITKGFSRQLTVEGGKIKSCSSSKKSVATVNNGGKITAKSTGKTKITVKLTNGKVLTCNVTVKPNKYSGKKLTISDISYNTYGMKAYSASFDSKGNMVVKFQIINNSYGKITSIPKFKITVKDSKKKTVASYSQNSYGTTVSSYDEKSCTITIPKSSLKTSANKIDLRNCRISITGEHANASL